MSEKTKNGPPDSRGHAPMVGQEIRVIVQLGGTSRERVGFGLLVFCSPFGWSLKVRPKLCTSNDREHAPESTRTNHKTMVTPRHEENQDGCRTSSIEYLPQSICPATSLKPTRTLAPIVRHTRNTPRNVRISNREHLDSRSKMDVQFAGDGQDWTDSTDYTDSTTPERSVPQRSNRF